MLRICFLSIIAAMASVASYADVTTASALTDNDRLVTVTAVTDNIIRVSNAPSDAEPCETGLLLVPASAKATATTPVTSATKATEKITTASGIEVSLDVASGKVVINAGEGRTIVDNGVRTLGSDGRLEMTLTTPGKESFYGAGERGYSLDLKGDTLVMFNKQNYGYTAGEKRIRQMNITMPILISSRGYAIVFDDFAAAELITSNPLKYVTEANHAIDFYFINGVDGANNAARMDNVVKQLSSITGRQQLPPLWSLGYITSKYGYHDQAETLGVIDTLKTAGYPVDGIVLDLYWYGKEEDMGRLAWDAQQWSDSKRMLADLKEQGVNLVAISQPYVLRNGRGIDNYNYLADKGMLASDIHGNVGEVEIWVGKGGMLDVSNPNTRKWLADRYEWLTDGGITGWWGDLGEPEVHPDTLVHANGLPARLYHNKYGNDWSEIIFDLFSEKYPDTRLMTMMRGGTIGLQRYNVFPWSTDVSRSWGGLQPQVVIMLNSGLSGLGYMSHDVGGFAIDPEHPYDPELYVRWLQLGTFSPILRTHAQQIAEPYKYPDHQDIILPLIKERYAWLPYNYTLAFENASMGLPLVRPLNFYEPGVNKYDGITDEYLWGRDVLVAPVLTQGATERTVVFPEGTWVDLNNPRNTYRGGDTITYPAPLSVLPMFVRAGSFIPRADYAMENTRDYDTSRYTVRFYPVEGQSDGYIFEDDLTSPRNAETGNYTLLRFNADVTPRQIAIDLTAQPGTSAAVSATANSLKTMTFEVYGLTAKPSKVTLDGRSVKSKFDKTTGTLTLTFPWNTAAPSRLLLNF